MDNPYQPPRLIESTPRRLPAPWEWWAARACWWLPLGVVGLGLLAPAGFTPVLTKAIESLMIALLIAGLPLSVWMWTRRHQVAGLAKHALCGLCFNGLLWLPIVYGSWLYLMKG